MTTSDQEYEEYLHRHGVSTRSTTYHPSTLYNFTGRIGRLQYLVAVVYALIASLIAVAILGVLAGEGNDEIVVTVVQLAATVPMVGAMVQRMRDIGIKWMWLPIAYGWLFLSVFLSAAAGSMLTVLSSIFMFAGIIPITVLGLSMWFVPGKREADNEGT